ncbi:response regulator [bacterium]|nr:response regulator [bacterium]
MSELNIDRCNNRSYKVLVVDDEDAVRLTIEEILKHLNCNVIHAGNGQEALDIVKTTNLDLIILDLLLPGKHGFSVCSDIRQMDKGRNVPILMITAVYTKMKYCHQAKEYGADAYMTKPFKLEAFINEVKRLLKIEKTQQMAVANAK